jgi:hypothetical protein
LYQLVQGGARNGCPGDPDGVSNGISQFERVVGRMDATLR